MMAIINEIKIGCAANRSLSLADGGERAFPTKDPPQLPRLCPLQPAHVSKGR
jgi:hypothetical protein